MLYSLIIVDDESEIRKGLSRFFPWSEIGFEVTATFESGLEAKTYLEKNEVDVILTDIKMPGISGIDLAKLVSEQYPDTLIVFLSGYSDFSYAKKAIAFGVKHYILKPTVYQELVDVFTKIKYEVEKKKNAAKAASEKGKPVDEKDTEKTYYEKIIAKIKRYIDENYSNASLESTASHVGMNPYYLSSFFKQHTKTKFIDYVLGVKMHKAAEMLQDPAYRIYEISDLTGYKNSGNFGRAFKAYFNVTPREYRMNGLKKDKDENT